MKIKLIILSLFISVGAYSQSPTLDNLKIKNKINIAPVYPLPEASKLPLVRGDVWFNDVYSILYFYDGIYIRPVRYSLLEDIVNTNIENKRNKQYLVWDSVNNKWINSYNATPHTKLVYADSSVVITGGTHIQITNAYDSLFRVLDIEGFNYLKGDTIEIIEEAGYNVICTLAGFGTNAVDWDIHTARKRNGVVSYGDEVISFTTTGANNQITGSDIFYNEYLPGDKIWLVLSRKSGSGDFTTTSGGFKIQLLYRR